MSGRHIEPTKKPGGSRAVAHAGQSAAGAGEDPEDRRRHPGRRRHPEPPGRPARATQASGRGGRLLHQDRRALRAERLSAEGRGHPQEDPASGPGLSAGCRQPGATVRPTEAPRRGPEVPAPRGQPASEEQGVHEGPRGIRTARGRRAGRRAPSRAHGRGPCGRGRQPASRRGADRSRGKATGFRKPRGRGEDLRSRERAATRRRQAADRLGPLPGPDGSYGTSAGASRRRRGARQ